MVKLSSKTTSLLKDDIISIIYENQLNPLLTIEIAKELRRDKEFTKSLLEELKKQDVLVEIKKNNKGKNYIKRSRWAINQEVLNKFQNEL
jgi:hypothetical protein